MTTSPPPPAGDEPFRPLTAQQLGLCGPLSDDPGVGPDAARHTPPHVYRPPRDFPEEGSFAVTRSVGSLRAWGDHRWRWDGHDWQPVVSAPPPDGQAARAVVRAWALMPASRRAEVHRIDPALGIVLDDLAHSLKDANDD